jgi:hypothetical protein
VIGVAGLNGAGQVYVDFVRGWAGYGSVEAVEGSVKVSRVAVEIQDSTGRVLAVGSLVIGTAGESDEQFVSLRVETRQDVFDFEGVEADVR